MATCYIFSIDSACNLNGNNIGLPTLRACLRSGPRTFPCERRREIKIETNKYERGEEDDGGRGNQSTKTVGDEMTGRICPSLRSYCVSAARRGAGVAVRDVSGGLSGGGGGADDDSHFAARPKARGLDITLDPMIDTATFPETIVHRFSAANVFSAFSAAAAAMIEKSFARPYFVYI